METILLRNVSFSYYDKIPALKGMNLDIGKGEKFAVIGSNGTGKSTLPAGHGRADPSTGRGRPF